MPDSQGVRTPDTVLRLLQILLLQRLPAPVIILQKKVVIRLHRSLKLAEFQVFTPLTSADYIMDEIKREFFPQSFGIADNGKLLIQQFPDSRGQFKMLRQESQQLQTAVLFFLYGEKDIFLEKRLPARQILSAPDIPINFHGLLQPQPGWGHVPRLFFRFLFLRFFRIFTGCLISAAQPLKPLRIVLRIGYRQLLSVSILNCPLILCDLNSQYDKAFRMFHTSPCFPCSV